MKMYKLFRISIIFLISVILISCDDSSYSVYPSTSNIQNDSTYNSNQVRDFDGNVYSYVTIGNQVWLAENLKTTRFSDGTEIKLVENDDDWQNLEYDEKAYCYYNNDYLNEELYGFGVLYTWAAAMNGEQSSDLNPSEVQGVCPDGWHLPSDTEWKELELTLGMSPAEIIKIGYRGTDQGSQLKTNGSSGFNAKLVGYRGKSGSFEEINTLTFFWSSTVFDSDKSWARVLSSVVTTVKRDGYFKNDGFSVRCVKD